MKRLQNIQTKYEHLIIGGKQQQQKTKMEFEQIISWFLLQVCALCFFNIFIQPSISSYQRHMRMAEARRTHMLRMEILRHTRNARYEDENDENAMQ